jgi:LAO/AO transport system kinase
MVDFFLLLMITGAGDDLQGIKRGVIEIADVLVINKADGDNREKAESLRQDYDQLLSFLQPATEGWQTRAYTCSSITGAGIADIWNTIETFRRKTTESGALVSRRRTQLRDWLRAMVDEQLHLEFSRHPAVRRIIPEMEKAVMDGVLPATSAAKTLLERFRE